MSHEPSPPSPFDQPSPPSSSDQPSPPSPFDQSSLPSMSYPPSMPPVNPPAPPLFPYQNPYQQYGPPPNNHLAFAIVTTIVFCWIFGIPGIVNAAKVDRLWMVGDHAGAHEAARRAKNWSWASIWTGIVFIIAYVCILIAVPELQ